MVFATVETLVDLVFPRRCVACSAPGAGVCASCLAPDGPLHSDFGMPSGSGTSSWPDTLVVVAATTYGGTARTTLLRYKERGRRDLAGPLGSLLGLAVTTLLTDGARTDGARSGPAAPTLVCVPSRPAAAAARGGDHVVRLARRAAAHSGVRLATAALSLDRAVQDSAGLDVAQRAHNLDGAMRARPSSGGTPAPRRAAIVVDDIVTTGATMREATRALRCAGWDVLGGAVVAATPRRFRAAPLAAPGMWG